MNGQINGHAELRVASYTEVIGPNLPMLGPLADGGLLIANTVQGCWGPMITPELKGGHEVTQPVAVVGAEVGDAVALAIEQISIRSRAAASGTHVVVAGRNQGDPAIAAERLVPERLQLAGRLSNRAESRLPRRRNLMRAC